MRAAEARLAGRAGTEKEKTGDHRAEANTTTVLGVGVPAGSMRAIEAMTATLARTIESIRAHFKARTEILVQIADRGRTV